MKHEHITSLMAFNANLQLAHWQADTLTSAHGTLGSLYEQMTGLTDQLAEVCMGKDGNCTFEATSLHLIPGANVKELLMEGIAITEIIRTDMRVHADLPFDDVLNILAEMVSAINRARYLLKV